MQMMGAEWFDACSSLIAFCKHSEVDEFQIRRFQNTLIRFFSMLHAVALGEIEEAGDEVYGIGGAFTVELIDPAAFTDDALRAIRDSNTRVELIFQWVQQYIVQNIKTGILSIPPPILSRSFQEIAAGMVHFHECMKISNVPFPFPYAQTCDALLVIHWILVPFVVSQWVTNAWWAGIFSFIQVFTLWTLNLIAVELENPFGTDRNDIDGARMQLDMNEHLRMLIGPDALTTPLLKQVCLPSSSPEEQMKETRSLTRRAMSKSLVERKSHSFKEIWTEMPGAVKEAARFNAIKNGRVSSCSPQTLSAVVVSQEEVDEPTSPLVIDESRLEDAIGERVRAVRIPEGTTGNGPDAVALTASSCAIPLGTLPQLMGKWELIVDNLDECAKNTSETSGQGSGLQLRLREIFEQLDATDTLVDDTDQVTFRSPNPHQVVMRPGVAHQASSADNHEFIPSLEQTEKGLRVWNDHTLEILPDPGLPSGGCSLLPASQSQCCGPPPTSQSQSQSQPPYGTLPQAELLQPEREPTLQ